MENHLLNEIFRVRTANHKKNTRAKANFFDWVRQLPHSFCPRWRFLSEHRLTMIRKVGLRRIEREIDIVRFIRNQITLTTIIKAMTSKAERNVVRNSYRFMVGNESEVNTTSESESDALIET